MQYAIINQLQSVSVLSMVFDHYDGLCINVTFLFVFFIGKVSWDNACGKLADYKYTGLKTTKQKKVGRFYQCFECKFCPVCFYTSFYAYIKSTEPMNEYINQLSLKKKSNQPI